MRSATSGRMVAFVVSVLLGGVSRRGDRWPICYASGLVPVHVRHHEAASTQDEQKRSEFMIFGIVLNFSDSSPDSAVHRVPTTWR